MGEQPKLFCNHGHLRKLGGGFSLVELMVALAMAGFLSIGLWALMGSQNKTYAVQDNASQMQQNLRAAINMMSNDLRTAGQGPAWSMTFNGENTAWYTLYPVATGVSFGQPYSHVADSNQVDMIVCSGESVTLGATATAGQNQITLSAGQGQDFAVGDYINIGDAGFYESARVTAAAGDVLNIDTNPGNNRALQNGYAQGTSVCTLQWITYSVDTTVNPTQLTRDRHDGNGAQPIAYNITALTATTIAEPTPNPGAIVPRVAGATPDGGLVQIALTASTGGANPVQSRASDIVHLRNP